MKSLSLVGKKKTGKTTLMLSAPKPLVVFDFELGVRRVEPRFIKESDKITVHKMVPASAIAMRANPQLALEFWTHLEEEYNKALEDSSVASIAFDTFSAVWEARRLAYLAELRKTEPNRKALMPQEHFVPNTDMKQIIVQALLHDKVLIVTHHTREKYEDVTDMMGRKQSKPTGEEVPDGFKYTGDLVDAEIWMTKKNSKPLATFKTCGLSMSVEGMEIPEPTFQSISDLVEGYRKIGEN